MFGDIAWVCCVDFKDSFRNEVPDAVAKCQKAGIVVRMVTGDHLKAAKYI